MWQNFLSIFPKMSYEIFLFPKIYWQNLAKHFFKGLTTDSMVFFSKHSSTTAILTEASVITLQMEFLDIFLYWFYIFNLHNFIFQRLIWKMISVYFLWFDYWTLKELVTAKVQNHSAAGYILFTQLICPFFDMFTAAMFIFYLWNS